MKKTLQEEKIRFRQIVEQGSTNMAYGFKPNQNNESNELDDLKRDEERRSSLHTGFKMELKELMDKYELLGHHGFTDVFQSAIIEMKDSDDSSNREMLKSFNKRYDKNMSQGSAQ